MLRRMLPGARHRPHHLADGADPLQGLHLDAKAERLPVDSYYGDRPRPAARRTADPHPRDARDCRIRHRRARALQGQCRLADRDAVAGIQRLCLAAPHHRAVGRGLQPGGIPRAHQARAIPRPGVLLHAQRQARGAAAPRQRHRFRLHRAHRRRRLTPSAARSTARSRRWFPSSTTATRSRSSPRRRRPRRPPPGSRWSSPARRAPPSAAPPAPPCAASMPALAAASSRRLCQRAKLAYSDEKLQGALPRLARGSIDDVFSAVGRGEMRAADVARAMYPDYKAERAAALRQQPKLESSRWFGFKRSKGVKYQAPAGGDGAIPIRGINGDLPVRFASRRRGAGRPHRRHPDAGRGDHHLSDPVAGAAGLRGRARALARPALGHRRARARALSRRRSRSRP